MDTATENKIRNVVNQFVKDGYMFTAWDITAFLRKNGEKIRHSDTKDVVTAMFANTEMGNYIRNVVDVSANPNPFLYFSPACDIDNYDQDWLNSNPSQTGMKDDATVTTATANVAAPVGTVVPLASSPSDKSVKTLSVEGRLNVSPELLYSVGLLAGDSYSVEKSANGIVIVAGYGSNGYFQSTVNSDGRVRLCKTCIEKYFGSKNRFKVCMNNGLIEVVPA